MALRHLGDGEPRVVALHGFTATGAQWEPVARRSPFGFVAPDLPGHGATRISPIDLGTTLGALRDVLEVVAPPRVVVGYSQGGRLALLLAAEAPELVDALVVVSASPGIAEDAERRRRRAADAALASEIEADDLDRFLDRWLAAPVTGTNHLPASTRAADRRMRRENTPRGLAAALRGYGQGSQPWILDALPDLPTWIVVGERDRRYRRLGARIATTLPTSELVVVPGAGHNVVLEAPEAVAAVVHTAVAETTAGQRSRSDSNQ